MAKKRLPYVVVDSCVFIDVFTKTPGRYQNALELLRGHNKQHVIVLPVLQLMEFYTFSQRNPIQNVRVRSAEFRKADDFIASQNYLPLELDGGLVKTAAERVWGKSVVKAQDAMMVAAAEQVGATHLYTYDARLIQQCKGLRLKVQVTEPPPAGTLPIVV